MAWAVLANFAEAEAAGGLAASWCRRIELYFKELVLSRLIANQASYPGVQLVRRFAMSKHDAAELASFLGLVADHDAEVIERWRDASPDAHARAMIELSRYAERMSAQTGLGKDPDERFPGIPKLSPRQKAA